MVNNTRSHLIKLPNLTKYRDNFIENGLNLPLLPVSTNENGLLNSLPKTESESGWPWNEETDPNVYDGNSTWPKLTIVTPSYNQGPFIEKTIRSVLLQNYPNLEYIIIDGGSTDNTKEVLEKYSQWISYWQSEKDNGQSHAINLGFSLASGIYYGWINSDDYYNGETFLTLVRHITKRKNKTFFYGLGKTVEIIDGEKIFKEYKPRYQLKRHIRIPGLLQPSCFWHKSIHEPIWEELICSMDYELWVRIFPKSNPYYIQEFLSVALIHDGAKTHNVEFKKHWQSDHEKIIRRHGSFSYFSWKKIMFELKIVNALRKLIRS